MEHLSLLDMDSSSKWNIHTHIHKIPLQNHNLGPLQLKSPSRTGSKDVLQVSGPI